MSQITSEPNTLLAQRAHAPIENLQSNAESILEKRQEFSGCLKRNEFDGGVWKCRKTPWGSPAGEEWSIHDQREFRSWIEKQFGWSPSDALLTNAVEVVAHRSRFHPVEDYLTSLLWDGIPRLNSWLSLHLGAKDTPYTQAVGRKFLISAVARIMIPGCKADYVLTLEGPQGIGKSSTFRTLMPNPSWFRDTPLDLHNKDSYLGLKGAWIIEFAELESMNRAAVARIKVYITSATDVYRPPYQKAVITHPRQCVFVATTNESDYLKDSTGGRRFWPVRCGNDQIDLPGIENGRDQLWAEAFAAFRAGESWYLGKTEEQLAKAEQEARREPDHLEDQIRTIVEYRDFVTIEDLLNQVCHSRESMNVRGALAKRLAKTLTDVLGWTKVRQYRGGRRVWGYMSASGQEVPSLDESENDAQYEGENASGRSGRLAESCSSPLDDDFE